MDRQTLLQVSAASGASRLMSRRALLSFHSRRLVWQRAAWAARRDNGHLTTRFCYR